MNEKSSIFDGWPAKLVAAGLTVWRSPSFSIILAVVFGAIGVALFIPGSSGTATPALQLTGLAFVLLTVISVAIAAWKLGRATERRRAHQSLFETLAASQEALYLTDGRQRIIYDNEAFRGLYE